MNGRVKYYNRLKGFGFITGDDDTDWPVMAGGVPDDVEMNCGAEVEFDLVKAVYEGLELRIARIRPAAERRRTDCWESGARQRTDENLRGVFG